MGTHSVGNNCKQGSIGNLWGIRSKLIKISENTEKCLDFVVHNVFSNNMLHNVLSNNFAATTRRRHCLHQENVSLVPIQCILVPKQMTL